MQNWQPGSHGGNASAGGETLPDVNLEPYMTRSRSISQPSAMPGQRPIPGLGNRQPLLESYAENAGLQSADPIRQAVDRNASVAKGRSNWLQGMPPQYPTPDVAQPARVDAYAPPQNPQATARFREAFDPQRGYAQFVPESLDLYASALEHAQTPRRWGDVMREMQNRHREAAALNAQRDAQKAQERYYNFMLQVERSKQALAMQHDIGEMLPDNLIASSEALPVSDIPTNLIAETGAVSAQYKPYSIPMTGEQAKGPKSSFPAKEITFTDDADLNNKLWSHFWSGQGQPVTIRMSKLNLSNNISFPKLFSSQTKEYIKAVTGKSKRTAANLSRLTGKEIDYFVSNEHVSHISFLTPFKGVAFKIDPKTDWNKFSAFGRLSGHIKNLEILIDHSKKTITLSGELYPTGPHNELDLFDFNPDPSRGEGWNTIVKQIHNRAPEGSTSFQIYGNGFSKFKKTYTFNDF